MVNDLLIAVKRSNNVGFSKWLKYKYENNISTKYLKQLDIARIHYNFWEPSANEDHLRYPDFKPPSPLSHLSPYLFCSFHPTIHMIALAKFSIMELVKDAFFFLIIRTNKALGEITQINI